LKELFGSAFYRERCANPTAVGETTELGYQSAVGSYLLDGYKSVLRFAPIFSPLTGEQVNSIQIDRLLLNAVSTPADQPAGISLRVGVSSQVWDPNKPDDGKIRWFQHSTKLLKWLAGQTPGTVPSELLEWKLFRLGRIIYVELTIDGVGGDCELSSATAKVAQVATRNY
jgi:hypothetical protein